MAEIEITANCYKPNIIILKNHIITFNNNLVILYDLNGLKLDTIEIEINKQINNMYKIDNNHFLVAPYNALYDIIIFYDKLKINNKMILNEKIFDCLILKNNLLILSLEYIINVIDMNSLKKENIQIIYDCYKYRLLNWDDDLFITYNNSSISLYKRIFGTKPYQLISKITLSFQPIFSYYKLLKLYNKTLLISNSKNIYLVDIKKIKINQNISAFNKLNDIKFICKIQNNVYFYSNNNLFMFEYFKGGIIQKKLTIKIKELAAFNYLLNLSAQTYYENLSKNLIINCVKNIEVDFVFEFCIFFFQREYNLTNQLIINLKKREPIKNIGTGFFIKFRNTNSNIESYKKRFFNLFFYFRNLH